jgi:hypothetical protein
MIDSFRISALIGYVTPAAGEGIAAIRVICGNGSPGIGGDAEGLTTRSSKEVSA